MTKQTKTPLWLQARSKDPLESSWRKHMVLLTIANMHRATGSGFPTSRWTDACYAALSSASGFVVTTAVAAELWFVMGALGAAPNLFTRQVGSAAAAQTSNDIYPNRQAEEDSRVCDACIRVVDEKMAQGISRRFGKGRAALPANGVSAQDKNHKIVAPLEPDKGGCHTVMTVGKYRSREDKAKHPKQRHLVGSIVAMKALDQIDVDVSEPLADYAIDSELHAVHSITSDNHTLIDAASTCSSHSNSKLRTPTKISRIPTSGTKKSGSLMPSSITINGNGGSNRLGMAARTTPRVLEKKVHAGTPSDFGPRSVVDDSVSKRPQSADTRRHYSASARTRMIGGDSGLKRTNSSCSMSSIASSVTSVTSVSSASLKAPSSSGFTKLASKTHKVWPLTTPSTILPEEFTLNEESVMALREEHELTEKGVRELMAYVSSSSTSTGLTKGRLQEIKLLKAGLEHLSTHSDVLMRCCEAFEIRTLEQNEQIDASSAEIGRLTRLLNSEPTKCANKALPELELEDYRGEATLSRSAHPISDSETTSTTSSQNIFLRFSGEETDRQRQDVQQAMQDDSPLSAYVRTILKKATDKIEEKWKTRFAEQLAEHEQALAQERERSSASVLSSSRLVTETLHGKDDELKAIEELNISLNQKIRQLELDLDAACSERDFYKQQMDEDDDERSVNAHSFWKKTTDLAKENRTLTEELSQANTKIAHLTETITVMKTKASSLKTENVDRVRESKSMIAEKNLLQDKLTAMEAKFEDEKHRREQFQVNIEQLTVENTALYAQMVALQTTHEAKMEEMQARYEKKNITLVGEMKLLQDQNRLMRKAEPITQKQVRSNNDTNGSSRKSLKPPTDDKETSRRIQELTDELLKARQELMEKMTFMVELEKKVAEGEIMRRKLHNTIQELRGNIRVHVRLRPFLRSDGAEAMAENPRPAIMCDIYSSTITTNVENPHSFSFDKIYGQSDSQETVFEDVSGFIQSAMDGYNVCIFAYGQTGSGKTHTMQGSGKAQMRGIIPRSIDLIIKCCDELTVMGWNFSLMVTFYEIYNETIRDLLTTESGKEVKHNIRTDSRGKNYVEGLTEVFIDFDRVAEQVDEIINVAACNRSVDRTDMNAHSSRSHSIFALSIRGYNESQKTEVEGSLSLVDLAGSERLSRSNVTGHRLKEAQAINKSLSALSDVFQALAKKSPHVPYRNSKLTYALQPALSGNGKTLMMANLSPTFASLDESLCSMRFAEKVSQCELGTPVRQIQASRRQSLGSGDIKRNNVRSSSPREPRRNTLTPGALKRLL
ncbi:hypothetical protein PsorP6_005402 [Peronosclerospora sorghi]|uniref:Uncharacterized protein n=1 Tax=Peronosclerospora sorghi TaxID=230839 RepID=A0ACC0W0P2_9STRA|nr:hypothetical protein PsorP6_005402 [Peronosclerospora sorghi]